LPVVVRIAFFSTALAAVGCAQSPPKAVPETSKNPTDCVAWEPRATVESCQLDWVLAQRDATQKAAAAEQQRLAREKAEAEQRAAAEQKAAEEKAAQDRAAQEAATAAAAAAKREPVRIYVGADSYFAFNGAELNSNDSRTLENVAERIRNDDQVAVRVVGYTDQIGSEEYNLSLSQRRADAVKTYLIEHGVPDLAVSVEARGEADPIVSCENRQGTTLIDCLQPNRRVEIEFSALEPTEGR